jgi:hypothetical protein
MSKFYWTTAFMWAGWQNSVSHPFESPQSKINQEHMRSHLHPLGWQKSKQQTEVMGSPIAEWSAPAHRHAHTDGKCRWGSRVIGALTHW